MGQKIGHIYAFLALQSRALNDHVSLFDAMDSISASTEECFEALYNADETGWSDAVEELYEGQVLAMDALFIEEIVIQPEYRGKGIGAEVVRETINTFASNGVGIVACKLFPLQYSGWEEHSRKQEPGFAEKRLAGFARVARFWTDLGFRKLPDSDFYTYAPELLNQGGGDEKPTPAPSVSCANRVRRGRRRNVH
jgi:GNAT superfamily N-acetyltransferase